MEEILNLFTEFGVPLVCLIALAIAFVKLLQFTLNKSTADLDYVRSASKDREDKLIENDAKLTAALGDIANQLAECNKVSLNASDTVKILVDKLNDNITNLNKKVDDLTNDIDDLRQKP